MKFSNQILDRKSATSLNRFPKSSWNLNSFMAKKSFFTIEATHLLAIEQYKDISAIYILDSKELGRKVCV